MREKRRCLAVVRVRGVGDASPDVEKTLEILKLNRNCHITLLDSRSSFLGMLQKVKNFVTWGEITKDTVYLLMKERGRLVGDKKLDDDHAQELGFKTLKDLADATYELKADFRHLPDVKPVFRAHPPKRGFKGQVKKSYAAGGVTGYRGEAVNKLIESMI